MNKWVLGWVLAGVLMLAVSVGAETSVPSVQPEKTGVMWVYVGNLAKGDKRGIYCFRMENGKLSSSSDKPEIATPDPSFLAIHPNEKILSAAAATKVADYAGAIEAYAI